MAITNESGLPPQPKSFLERFLSLFSVVRSGEGGTVLLLTLNVFLLLGAYYFLKIVRETLILAESGAVAASYAAAGQALLLLLVVPAYGILASKVDRIRLVSWATLFFVSHLVVFYLVGSAGFRIGIAFYLWVGVFNVFVVAQFWAFANDIYSQEQGKRLFPIISVGASLGAWIGTQIIEQTFASLGAYVPMIIGGGILIVCVLITIWVNRRMLARGGVAEEKKASEPLGKEGAFHLIRGSRYLMSIAALILLLNLVNTTGGFLHNSLVASNADAQVAAMTDATEDERDQARTVFIGEYFADFFGWVNLMGLLIQMFLVSRIFKFLGVRLALFILPCIAIGGYALLIALPMLQIVRVVKIAENSTDYSLMNTIRAALYLPTSREAKYKAKQAIDTFFVRLGDMLQAGVVFVGTWLGLSLGKFAAVLAFFCVLWILAALSIYKEHKKLTREA